MITVNPLEMNQILVLLLKAKNVESKINLTAIMNSFLEMFVFVEM